MTIKERDGLRRIIDSDIEQDETTISEYKINGLQDPLSANINITHDLHLKFRSSTNPIKCKIRTNSSMTCDLDNFHLDEHLKVEMNDEAFYENTYKSTVPRIFS